MEKIIPHESHINQENQNSLNREDDFLTITLDSDNNLEKFVEKMGRFREAILSNKVRMSDIEGAREAFKELFNAQEESLRRKIWEKYNNRLPKGMRYVPSLDFNLEEEKYYRKEGKYEEKEKLVGHEDHIETLQVLPDGTIVSGNWDGTIRIWKRN